MITTPFVMVRDMELGFSLSSRTVTLQVETGRNIVAWYWKILSVPEGSVAKSGQHQDFKNGVATVQNPQLEIDAGLTGLYILRCIATADNGEDSQPVGCYIRVSPMCDTPDPEDPLERQIVEETKRRAAIEQRRQMRMGKR